MDEQPALERRLQREMEIEIVLADDEIAQGVGVDALGLTQVTAPLIDLGEQRERGAVRRKKVLGHVAGRGEKGRETPGVEIANGRGPGGGRGFGDQGFGLVPEPGAKRGVTP